jgi:inactivated superfamily I helicase
MMTIEQVQTATLDQLTDELAAAGWDSTQQTLGEAREAVLALLAEVSRLNTAAIAKTLQAAIHSSESLDEITHIELDCDSEAALSEIQSLVDCEVDSVMIDDNVMDVWGFEEDAPNGEMLWRLSILFTSDEEE